MQESAWRYRAEFMIRILINGQNADETVRLAPSPSTSVMMSNYGLLTRAVPGGLLAYVRQSFDGVDWTPVVEFEESAAFSFWLLVRRGADFQVLDFFDDGSQVFGRQIFYANNLSATGAIDSNLAGQIVTLTAGNQVGNTERGALSTYLLSAEIAPGDFTLLEAGKVAAGLPVSFSISQPIQPNQSTVALDLRLLPKGMYVVRLQGPSPVEERVVFDEEAARADLNGIIEIYKDAWQTVPQPREYRIDFSST
jgi:hypothetical protein